MATTIEQKPVIQILPVGQDVIFTVSNSPIVSGETRVKIIAEVYIDTNPIVIASSSPVGTFKTTPNNAGVGMFNFSPIIESFVKSDNSALSQSKYKTTLASDRPFSLHIVDKYSRNGNSVKYIAINFTTEYLDNDPTSSTFGDIILDGTADVSEELTVYNGYVKNSDVLMLQNSNFGFNFLPFALSTSDEGRFLTNAPIVQYATKNDYGTLAIAPIGGLELAYIKFTYTLTDGSTIDQKVDRNFTNGAYTSASSSSKSAFIYIGCFPGNLRNWSGTFQPLIAAGTLESYTVQCFNASDQVLSESIKINLLCPNTKGYEPIRLTWLNQYGTWDYYTFNMKSSKMISTKGSTYQQLEGSWNDSTYKVDSFRGGKKAFRVNATEKITMNTDFVNESETAWFEELINSPEVFILNGYDTSEPAFSLGNINALLNTYVIPVRLTTSSYTRKTIANDKIMQYTFEVEKSKTLRTQSV